MSNSYILASIDSGGYILAEKPYSYNDGNGLAGDWCDGQTSRLIHRESVNLDKQDSLRCFARLDMAKAYYTSPSQGSVIIGLNEHGQGESIWASSEKVIEVKNRLKIWSGCYGAWPVKTLNG